jgi:integrase/recombinase XerD
MKQQIDEFIDYMKNVKGTSRNTLLSYKRDLDRLLSYLDNRGVSDLSCVTEDVLQDYCTSLYEENYAPASITRHNTSIKSFFRYLLENGNIAENPAENIKSPRIEKKQPRVLTTVEIEKLLSQDFGRDPKGLRDRAILELMYATGLKASEVINLGLSNVDLGLGCIRLVGGGKKPKERLIPYGRKARQALNAYLTEGRDGLLSDSPDSGILFLNCSGLPMSRQGLWKLIKSYVERAGIKSDITPFTLRHSFAVHLVDNGADISSVQELMGYSDINTVSRYLGKNKNVADPYEWARIRN